jgi:hypothetical protein
MKRLIALGAVVAAALTALRSWQERKADAELWREATTPRDDT